VTNVVGHGGRGGGGGGGGTTVVVVTVVRRASVSRVSGVGGHGAHARRRQIAYAAAPDAIVTAEIVGASLLIVLMVRRVVSTRGHRRPIKRLQFGGHAVVDNVEAHGRQRHAGQYVHGTEPHGGRAGERHL